MLFRKKLILGILSLTVITSITVTTEAAERTRGIKVSSGEEHTIVLTEDKFVWGCGANFFYQLGIGYFGDVWTLIRVHDGDMSTPSDYLEDINDIDAGWMHSLALDMNGFVWAWGDNCPISLRFLLNSTYLNGIIGNSPATRSIRTIIQERVKK